jgi:hypothetical protein
MFFPSELLSTVIDNIADDLDLRAGALVYPDWTPICQRKLSNRIAVYHDSKR